MTQHGIAHPGLSAEDIVDGKLKFLLGLSWRLARTFQFSSLTLSEPVSLERLPNSYSSTTSTLSTSTSTTSTTTSTHEETSSITTQLPSQTLSAPDDDVIMLMLTSFISEVTRREDVTVSAQTYKDGVLLSTLVTEIVTMNGDYDVAEMDQLLVLSEGGGSTLALIEKSMELADTYLEVPPILFAEDLAAGETDDQSLMLYLSLLRAAYDEQKERKDAEDALTRFSMDFNKRWDSDFETRGDRYSTVVRAPVLEQVPEKQMMISKVAARPTTMLMAPPVELDNSPTGGYWDESGAYLIPLSEDATYEASRGEGVQMPDAPRQIVDVSGMGEVSKKSSWFSKVKNSGKRFIQESRHEFEKFTIGRESASNSKAMERFHQRFRFTSSEPLYHEFPCKFASGKHTMMIGSAYITKNFLCLAGTNPTQAINVILPLVTLKVIDMGVASFRDRFKAVPVIHPHDPESSVPANALLITDANNFIHRFYSITNIELCFATLSSLWKSAKSAPVATTKKGTGVGKSSSTKVSATPPALPPRPQMINTSEPEPTKQDKNKQTYVDSNLVNRQGKSNLLLGKNK
eukprot:TRINITY_DN5449_c0_g1_i1.p1 TRINITY_DN5449_c0_g1~~TRINITY_DN5449_c0_g1_i1.p1  ORF type:complete len:595 (-),score=109.47 TRINITY_DN5449_c0_g1_i1:110-1831(-)